MAILPTVCADGTALPTSLVYPSDAYDLWDTWVEDVPPDDDHVVGSSTGGAAYGLNLSVTMSLFIGQKPVASNAGSILSWVKERM